MSLVQHFSSHYELSNVFSSWLLVGQEENSLDKLLVHHIGRQHFDSYLRPFVNLVHLFLNDDILLCAEVMFVVPALGFTQNWQGERTKRLN